ncbi:hypothetical protein CK203_110079 [Vitis vinifera]|uniref:Retrotransposon gag domain-containing protein n=1 Tax=Vitis vinifera TaxID=29760 RepID=A0A438CDK8_VITVI|nr:hypothetical protein CK203_110079 [Vitis vinifera]
MQDNESLREFMKRFGQAVLQVEAYSMDAVLQIFKRSICPGTPFFESLAKKPPTTMDDLFRRANKYSMLEDDVQAATQQVLVAGQASRSGAERSAKLPDWPRPFDRRCLDPLERTHPKEIIAKMCLPQGTWSHNRDMQVPPIFGRKAHQGGHLKQYLLSNAGGRDASQNHNSGAPRAPTAPNIGARTCQLHSARNNWGGGGGGPRPIDGTIVFPPVDPTRILQPHHDALILSLEIGDFDVRRILVDPGSSADLVQASVVSHMGHNLIGLENPGRILSGFNGSSTISLGDIVLPVQAGPVTLNVQFSVVQDLSPFNVILGRTWLHYMKAIPSTYHQMIAREAGTSQEDASLPESSHARDQ